MCIRDSTKAVVVNSPNNPSGAVYSEQTIKRLADILRDKDVYKRQVERNYFGNSFGSGIFSLVADG